MYDFFYPHVPVLFFFLHLQNLVYDALLIVSLISSLSMWPKLARSARGSFGTASVGSECFRRRARFLVKFESFVEECIALKKKRKLSDSIPYRWTMGFHFIGSPFFDSHPKEPPQQSGTPNIIEVLDFSMNLSRRS